ncbi:hypothetical protein ACRAWG_19315 [Methylobacterium sp. P31]
MREIYPSEEALSEAVASGSTGASGEQFMLVDGLIVSLDAKV